MSETVQPKVFVSYAWTDDAYSLRVIEFCSRLIKDAGVEIILDKFEMLPGKEMNNFMERSVHDEDVTNVLLLLNPTYAEKANKKEGGVGKETQIISEEVYNDIDQTKFIPVIFDVIDDDFSKSKPTYLKSRFHIDLSNAETYELNYMNLVKTLYGKEMYQKPIKGKKPSWVDEPITYMSEIYQIKEYGRKDTIKLPSNKVSDILDKILSSLINDNVFLDDNSWTSNNIYKTYVKLTFYRNNYIELFNESRNMKNFQDVCFRFFQNVKDESLDTKYLNSPKKDYLEFFLHEIFIYSIALLYKSDDYNMLNQFIYTPYVSNVYGENAGLQNYAMFFYANNKIDSLLSTNLKERDGKDYYSAKAHTWQENIYEKLVTKDELVSADVLLANLSILSEPKSHFQWFAATYPYSQKQNSILKRIALSLESKRLGKKYLPLFNAKDFAELKIKFDILIKHFSIPKNNYGYSSAFDSIEVITSYIELDKIGSLN